MDNFIYQIHRRCLNIFIILIGTAISSNLYATHNRAGEITYEQIGELTIRVTITTYTKTSSIQADRDTLDILWGDGTQSRAGRINGDGDILPNDIKRNYYVAVHTYPGRATYHISTTDPNRIDGILNVNFPNSISIPFHLETTFTFLSTQFQGSNSSAILLQPPIDYACLGQRFVHNPNAYDPDGDSLAYELIIPRQEVNTLVPNYLYPDQIQPGTDNVLTLDEKTGDLIWDAPQRSGEYNVAFKILEYRDGVLLNSIIRDMQILVESGCAQNSPPIIDVPEEICVIAGDEVTLQVTATDPDDNQQLSLSALGGPLEVMVSPATFSNSGIYQNQPVSGVFRWITTCEHIAEQAYSVVFKAVDDTQDTSGLATLKTLQIKVVGPPPENVMAESQQGANRITWDKPYACEVTEDDYFLGFTVWRRINSSRFAIDSCTPGLEGRGYTAIAFSILDMQDGQYVYLDRDVNEGDLYCYRVTATFARISAGGYPFNLVHSLASNEACAGIMLDVPYITEVSVRETDPTSGQINVTWTRPDPTMLDTTIYTGPYQFTLVRGTGFSPGAFTPVTGASFSSTTFGGLTDTSFIDQTGLNTLESPYTYQVWFYAGDLNEPLTRSQPASSVFLTVVGQDKRNSLSWSAEVPWQNYTYRIFRKDPGATDFVELNSTNQTSFVDRGLANNLEYCYYIETEGSYGSNVLPEPLLNLSQEACAIPTDTDPPCVPVLQVSNSCDSPDPVPVGGVFLNQLNWSIPTIGCDNPEDVAGYRVYYAPNLGTPFEEIAQIDDPTITHYEDGSEIGVAGCYTVTALDSLGNESDTSNIICVENCPFYSLPNVFTPNSDGANDLFKPYPYKFIERIDLKVFNRWGQLVFETTDPEINWNGQNLNGNDLSQGVYHYICQVFEAGVTDPGAESTEVLTGFIELIR